MNPGTSPTASRADRAPRAPSGRWWILGVICLAQLMVVLDATVVNIALPSAQEDLGFSNAGRQWVVTAYALAFGGLLLLGGRLADRFGRERMLIIGMAGFAAASALAGAAANFEMLVAGRAVQGIFGALLAPAALSTLTVTFTDLGERAKAFGIYGAISGAGGAIGLLLGGVLTEYLDWRWTLYVNVAFAVFAIVAAVRLLHMSPRNPSVHVDVPGAVLVISGLVSVVYGLSRAETHSWGDGLTIGFLVAGVVLLAGFIAVEQRVAHPLLPLRVVTDRFRGGAYLTIGLAASGMFAVFLFLTYYLQLIQHLSPVRTGIAFLPMIAVLVLSSTAGSTKLMPRFGPRILIPTGLVIAAAGMGLLANNLDITATYAGSILPPLLIVGAGLGIVFSAAMNTATFGAAHSDAGVASAMVNTVQQIGGAIGTALLSTIAANALSDYISHHGTSAVAQAHAAITSYTAAFWVAAAIFLGAALASSFVLRSGVLTAPSDDSGEEAPAVAV